VTDWKAQHAPKEILQALLWAVCISASAPTNQQLRGGSQDSKAPSAHGRRVWSPTRKQLSQVIHSSQQLFAIRNDFSESKNFLAKTVIQSTQISLDTTSDKLNHQPHYEPT